MCFLGKKEFVFDTQRDSFLNAQVINAGIKEGDRSAFRRGMKLIKQQLCFRITAKLGNSKGQHCSRQEKKKNIYIYIYLFMRRGPLFYSHMNRRNTSYVQGAKC